MPPIFHFATAHAASTRRSIGDGPVEIYTPPTGHASDPHVSHESVNDRTYTMQSDCSDHMCRLHSKEAYGVSPPPELQVLAQNIARRTNALQHIYHESSSRHGHIFSWCFYLYCISHNHGMFQFYGANRSGRWAGRLIQLQNLPQNHMPDLAEARKLVRTGDYDTMEMLYDDIPDTLSQLIRTAFIARPGYKFIVSDYSAIEARVLAHLAGETWRSKVFTEGKDIYCASASQMFGVPVEKHGVNSHLRQKGKIAELALGYGGSVGALKSMSALEMGLTEEELQPLVDSWRNSNPMITAFWWDIDSAVKTTIKQRIPTKVRGINFCYKSGMLFIKLPSGRMLSYVKPRIGENRFGGESVTYEGIGSTKKWKRIESYGPKFVENIVQVVSRDLLCYAMQNISGLQICGHVHDELIIECPENAEISSITSVMGKSPDWMPDILIRGDGYETKFYKKD